MTFLPSALDHVLQDQVSDLEFPGSHLLVVSYLILLLIGCDADLGLLTPFL